MNFTSRVEQVMPDFDAKKASLLEGFSEGPYIEILTEFLSVMTETTKPIGYAYKIIECMTEFGRHPGYPELNSPFDIDQRAVDTSMFYRDALRIAKRLYGEEYQQDAKAAFAELNKTKSD